MADANNYEVLYVIDANLGEEGIAAMVEKFKTLVEENGTLNSIDEWGKRRLAYEINHISEGYYVLMTFTANVDFPAELERIFGITEGILRSLVILKEQE